MVAETEKSKPDQAVAKPKAVRKTRPKLNLSDMILIKNGFGGRLIVHLPKAGYDVIFDSFGDEDYIELAELKTLRNSVPKYFKNNWIIIDDPDVIAFLKLEGLYKNSIGIEDMASFFELSAEDMENKIAQMSDGQKMSLMYQVLKKIETGELDSRRTIAVLEKALDTQLIEQ